VNSPIFGILSTNKKKIDPASKPAAGQRLEVTNCENFRK